jgi:hypothetical protein
MTELEALRLALEHYSNSSPEAPVNEARAIVRVLIKRFEDAEADPEVACDMAETVMNWSGQYVTATFSRGWLDDVLVDHATRELTQGEIQSLLYIMVSYSIDDAFEQTLNCVMQWLEENSIWNRRPSGWRPIVF